VIELDVPACKTRLYLSKRGDLGLYNLERVRQVWEKDPKIARKKIAAALGLDPSSVSRHLKVIQGQQ
jgi:DNA-binding MarR family transcriptional regulator